MELATQVRGALTVDQWAALEAIVEGEEAWSSVTALELSGVAGDTIAELLALDLAARWEPLVGPGLKEDLVTLSEWGAYILGVEIDERMEVEDGAELEVPFWVMEGKGSDCVVLPKHARGCRLPFPELVADPVSQPDPMMAPKYLLDTWSGEPVMIWGHPVLIDHRRDRRRKASA
jgi:hypothetical protein